MKQIVMSFDDERPEGNDDPTDTADRSKECAHDNNFILILHSFFSVRSVGLCLW